MRKNWTRGEVQPSFFIVACVNVLYNHIDVIFSYLKASYQSSLLNGIL